ncbi:MAG: hypothetical protein ACW98I_18185 [Candidatus Hodarchaeales archaeon]|jgi:hypothetical protein
MSIESEFLFSKPGVSDNEIIEYLNQRKNVTMISFISPYTGIPHMCPVWGILSNGRFFFQSDDFVSKTKAIRKGNDKIGISIADPTHFPDYSEGSIPYISFGGTAKIRSRDEFADFELILNEIFLKYILDKEERDKVLHYVLNNVKTRILVEIIPEWIKVAKIPKNNENKGK